MDPRQRLDQRVVTEHPELSRASAAKLITGGKVAVAGAQVNKPAYLVAPDDKVSVELPNTSVAKVDLPIIYEDEDCLVINKPAGLLTHSKGAFNPEPTIASFLQQRQLNDDESRPIGNREGIVHRLDRGTSGVIICAKNPLATKWLQKQFSTRKVIKTYVALVDGVPKSERAVIDMPMARNPKRPQTFRVDVKGKPATTEYRVLQSKNGLSEVELLPTTGRTHQLRVHLAKLGHPILGDTLYGGAAAERLYLHALRLTITLPGGGRHTFEAPLPDEFRVKIDKDA